MNAQIEMISFCGTDGSIKPLRFRIEGEDQSLITVSVSQIVCAKAIQYAGVDAIQYLCKAIVDGKEKLFELRYTVRSHCWTLFRTVY